MINYILMMFFELKKFIAVKTRAIRHISLNFLSSTVDDVYAT